MPNYRRWRVDGGVFFFTLVTHQRRALFQVACNRRLLRHAIAEVRGHYPFQLDGMVLLPDHLHLLMRLPEGDSGYSRRISALKQNFTRAFLASGGRESQVSVASAASRHRGVWQKRFYEHWIRDYRDFKRHLDYIHINPVRHGLVEKAGDWAWSSFHRYVRAGWYEPAWDGPIKTAGFEFGPEFW